MPTTGNILVTSFAPRSRSHGARHGTSQSRGLFCYVLWWPAASSYPADRARRGHDGPWLPALSAPGHWSWSTVTVLEQNKINTLLPAKQLLDMHIWCW